MRAKFGPRFKHWATGGVNVGKTHPRCNGCVPDIKRAGEGRI